MTKQYSFSLYEGSTLTKGSFDDSLNSPELELSTGESEIVKMLKVYQSCVLRDGYLIVTRTE